LINISDELLNVLLSDTVSTFKKGLVDFFKNTKGYSVTLWEVSGNLCEAVDGTHTDMFGRFDLHDFGYEGSTFSDKSTTIEFFEDKIEVCHTIFLMNDGHVFLALTFHDCLSDEFRKEILPVLPALSKRISELDSREANVNVYVEYQKKIEFIKKGSRIFKAIETDEVIAVALSFFMEVFAAEASCCIYNNEFVGYGVEIEDLENDITMMGSPIVDFVRGQTATEYFEEGCFSSKFNVENLFVVYDQVQDIHFLLFNIHFDIVPDKEFSELVSSIVSIAFENAVNHEQMTSFKVEEAEMQNTVKILSKFVDREIDVKGEPDIYGINYPARSAGGDFLIVKDLGDKMFITLADVCGKGYSAAVFTVVLSVFSELAALFEKGISLEAIMRMANKFLIDKKFDDRFITGFFCMYDKANSCIEYISCGHEPAFLIGDGTQLLHSEYVPMGIMVEDYEVKKVKIEKESTLFIYTDGIIEYIDEETLLSKLQNSLPCDGSTFVQGLYGELVDDKDSQKDDFTCVMLRF
jgi:hypothetical protein